MQIHKLKGRCITEIDADLDQEDQAKAIRLARSKEKKIRPHKRPVPNVKVNLHNPKVQPR